MKIILLLFSAIAAMTSCVFAQSSITGTWSFKGYYQEASGNALGSLNSADGTVVISSNAISLNLSGGPSFSDTVNFELKNGSFVHSEEEVVPKEPDAPAEDPTYISFSSNLSVRPIDDNTCIIIYGESDYWFFGTESVAIAGVLTKAPLSDFPQNPDWSGKRSGSGMRMKDEYWATEGKGLSSQTEQVTTEIENRNGSIVDVWFASASENQRYQANTSSYQADFSLSNSVRRLLWEDEHYRAYLLEENENNRSLYLPDGRVLAVTFYTLRVDMKGVEDEFGFAFEDYQRLGDLEASVHLLDPLEIATVKDVRGSVTVLRNNLPIPVFKGMKLYEGDYVQTGKGSFTRLLTTDKSSMNIGPKSLIKIQRYVKSGGSIINCLTGAIRSFFVSPRDPGSILTIRSRNACLCVRGTTVEYVVSQENGLEVVDALVEEGVADFIDEINSQQQELTDGESATYSHPLIQHAVTINAPSLNGGDVFVDGSKVTNYPHVVNINSGDSVKLTAARHDGYRFLNWSGDLLAVDPTQILAVEEDMTITPQFQVFDYSMSTYRSIFSENSGYEIFSQQPDGDANNDGVLNAVAYGMGYLPSDSLPTGLYSRLPKSHPSQHSGRSALAFFPPSDLPSDIVFIAEVSETLGSASWLEIARKQGNAAWFGTDAGRIGLDSSSGEHTETIVEYPIAYDSLKSGFMRIRFEIAAEEN